MRPYAYSDGEPSDPFHPPIHPWVRATRIAIHALGCIVAIWAVIVFVQILQGALS